MGGQGWTGPCFHRNWKRLDRDEAVKCAEALGKRAFILEVMPHAALDLTIDRNAPKEKKGVVGVVERMGRILGIHKVS